MLILIIRFTVDNGYTLLTYNKNGINYCYGRFSGVTNYIALIGRKNPELDKKCVYYGEHPVIAAQKQGT